MISVIVPAKNEAESIRACLQSLRSLHLDGEETEIVVVDGNSTDETRKIAETYADRVVTQEQKGIGGARKDGVLASCGDILVFTDADTLHRPDWLSVIGENLYRQDFEVCTGPILFLERTMQSELLSLWRKTYNVLHLFNFYWLIGSNMAMKREVYEKIDGHRNISLLEDYDLSVRMFREGDIRCTYDPRQEVYTSARRLSSLLSYLMIYAYGHFHYHVTRDYQRLLNYPQFDEMDLEVILEVLGAGEADADARRGGAGRLRGKKRWSKNRARSEE